MYPFAEGFGSGGPEIVHQKLVILRFRDCFFNHVELKFLALSRAGGALIYSLRTEGCKDPHPAA